MITIRRPKSVQDLIACVHMYMSLDEPGLMPASYDKCLKSLVDYWSRGACIRIAEEDGLMLGWILGVEASLEHVSERLVSQRYYASKCPGMKAYRVLVLLHSELLVYAARLKATYCTSTGSHFDEKFVFAKMLEKSGWKRRGYLALFYMKDYDGRQKRKRETR